MDGWIIEDRHGMMGWTDAGCNVLIHITQPYIDPFYQCYLLSIHTRNIVGRVALAMLALEPNRDLPRGKGKTPIALNTFTFLQRHIYPFFIPFSTSLDDFTRAYSSISLTSVLLIHHALKKHCKHNSQDDPTETAEVQNSDFAVLQSLRDSTVATSMDHRTARSRDECTSARP